MLAGSDTQRADGENRRLLAHGTRSLRTIRHFPAAIPIARVASIDAEYDACDDDRVQCHSERDNVPFQRHSVQAIRNTKLSMPATFISSTVAS